SDWKCALCKLPSGKSSLGDLYGPYYIEPYQHHQKKESNEPQEVWVHEDCVVWSSNLYMLNGKLMNLHLAIQESADTKCIHCHKTGATMACLERKCGYRALHYPCAYQLGFHLDEGTFTVLCPMHSPPSLMPL